MTKFRDLLVGDTFDFINDKNRMLNSYFERCIKVSTRKYAPVGRLGEWHHVGSINVEVFHVENRNALIR